MALVAASCALVASGSNGLTATAAVATDSGVTIYSIGQPVDDSDFVDLTAQIPALGGTVLSGNPTIKVRFDAPGPDGTTAHGVFEQLGQATIRIVFPFDEHIQVIHGLLKVTDSNGVVSYLSPGDSYFIAQGSVILWQTLTPVFQKSFFNYTH
jgi:uncharacterized cupin superfamily protein